MGFGEWKFCLSICLDFKSNNYLKRYFAIRKSHTNAYQLMNQFSSVAQSCPTLCDPMNCSTSGLPVHHQLPEFTQTHIHQDSDAIWSSHPLLSPFPPAPNPSQHQSLFQWVNSSHEVAKVLEFENFISYKNHRILDITEPNCFIFQIIKLRLIKINEFPRIIRTSLVAQMVKNTPAMRETWVQSLGWEGPLEKGLAIHSNILPGESHGQRNLAGYSPWDRKSWTQLSN